ncbi:MAG: hypothetical protein OEN20_01275, partial [Gammaproteobacteria bacterium]|nr:hypothetical protein [Gammaproteobacteria bacterium]
MNANELRDMVREVLHDELVRRRAEPAAAHEQQIETVALGSDRDLMSFVHRIVTLAGDSRKRRALESG